MWRSLLAAVVVVAVSGGSAWADEPDGSNAVRGVIQSQLDAFEQGAVSDAYEFAAPNIRRLFPTPEGFGKMVEGGYPMIWDPSRVDFLDAFPRGPMIVQRLRVVDQAGVPYIAEYAMLQVEGEWRIAGVEIVRDDSFGA